ncbi:unnamed protein product, partial [Phaeothamnion confervicola]
QRRADDAVESRYREQVAMKHVCEALARGMRDQRHDFNHHKEEELPASWLVSTEGRPGPSSSAVTEGGRSGSGEAGSAAAAGDGDSVCMACFDGTPTDRVNEIVFCDGCNCSLHQKCAGVTAVPEGEAPWFCDWCLFQLPKPEEGRCVLCPVKHGGLKRTECNNWCHLCCAVWTPGARILDPVVMSPVDLSETAWAAKQTA